MWQILCQLFRETKTNKTALSDGRHLLAKGRDGECREVWRREELGCCQKRKRQWEPRAEAKWASQVALLLGAGGK